MFNSVPPNQNVNAKVTLCDKAKVTHPAESESKNDRIKMGSGTHLDPHLQSPAGAAVAATARFSPFSRARFRFFKLSVNRMLSHSNCRMWQ